MADFITLTDINGVRETVNVDRIIRVYQHNKGSVVIYGRDHSEQYRETPEQIDAMLGVTDSGGVAELVAAIKLVRSIVKDGAEVGFNCHSGDWAERLFASQAVTHRALIKSGAGA